METLQLKMMGQHHTLTQLTLRPHSRSYPASLGTIPCHPVPLPQGKCQGGKAQMRIVCLIRVVNLANSSLKSPWQLGSFCPSPQHRQWRCSRGILTSRHCVDHSTLFFQHRGLFLCAMSKDLVNEWQEAATLSMTLGVFHCPWHVLLAYGSVRMGTAQLRCKQVAVPAMPEDSVTMNQNSP